MGFLIVVHSAAKYFSESASTLIFRELKKWMGQNVI